MSREKIHFYDISTFVNVFVKPYPSVINLVGPINESLNETHFVRVRGEAEMIS